MLNWIFNFDQKNLTPVDTLDQKRIELFSEYAEAQKYAIEACNLAEKARALALEIRRKKETHLARKKSMMGSEIFNRSNFKEEKGHLYERRIERSRTDVA